MYLPAAAAVFGGTNYDLVASGRGTSFVVRGNVNVISGLNTDLRSTPFAVKTATTVLLTGKVNDLCTGVGIQAATLELVVPDATISPVPDCRVIPRPAQCVVAFSASTDEAGTYPLPGNGFVPPAFNAVPLPSAGAPYELDTTAAGFDRTHTLQIGWLYELPMGKGKMLAKSGPAAAILGGWQVNGIFAAYTGTPYTVTAPGSSLNAPNNTQTADQVNPTVTQFGNVGPGQLYFDPTAFAAVTGVRFGSSGRDILRTPGVLNTDLDIAREFTVKERAKLQFRAQFFNLANTSHFGAPSASVTSGTFGQITSASGERNIRFGLRMQW